MTKFLRMQGLLAWLLLSSVLLSLTACGGGGSEPTPNNPGNSSSPTSQASSAASSTARLNAPTSLEASRIGSTKVILSWEKPDSSVVITTYRLTRNGTAVGTTNGNITEFTDTSLMPENQYTYRIQAGDAEGNWSALSTSFIVRTAPAGNDWTDTSSSSSSTSSSTSSSSSSSHSSTSRTDTTAPSSPTGFTATNIKDNSIDLVWNASIDNVGVTLYRITRDGNVIATVSGQTLAYLDMNLKPDTAYNYRVQAGDAAGNWSGFSSRLNLRTSSGITGTNLRWSHPTQRENGQYMELHEIGGYEIRYRPNSLGSFTTIKLPGNQTNEYPLESLPNSYDYQIAVYDTQGLYSEFVIIIPR